jgi:hypothetical protein
MGFARTYAIVFRRCSSSRITVDEKRSPKRCPFRPWRRLNSWAWTPFIRCIPAERDASSHSTTRCRCVSMRHQTRMRQPRSTTSRARRARRKRRSRSSRTIRVESTPRIVTWKVPHGGSQQRRIRGIASTVAAADGGDAPRRQLVTQPSLAHGARR